MYATLRHVVPLGSFLGALEKLRHVTISFDISVSPSAWNNSASTGLIFMKFDIRVFSKISPENFQFHYSLTGLTGTPHGDLRTVMAVSL
jgi:hypothetical protein